MFNRVPVLFCAAVLAAFSLFGQDYKLEPFDAAPQGLPAAYSSVALQKTAFRVAGASGAWCEIWLRASVPPGPKPADSAISFAIAQGTLVGILRFPAQGSDRRAQAIKPGLYTLRYSDYPVDGAHQGVAPQRDFLLLTPIADDPDPNATPAFDALVAMSNKASGTPHPAVLSIETPAEPKFPTLTKEGDHDWVLNVKLGDVPLSIIVVGKADG